MTRFVVSSITAAIILGSSPASATPPQAQSPEQVLVNGLHALGKAAANAQPQSTTQTAQASPQAQQTDNDQGDDHASDTAILKVCSHTNPSATHAAICPQPNSPN
jgi:hypothetical protein